MATGYCRGHLCRYDDEGWRYVDTGVLIDDDPDRLCPRCGRPPTPEGYDACLGHIPGVTSACCGHGNEPPYMVRENKEIR